MTLIVNKVLLVLVLLKLSVGSVIIKNLPMMGFSALVLGTQKLEPSNGIKKVLAGMNSLSR